MNKLLIFLLSMCVTSLEAATITNWGAQLPTAVPASGDVILMQKGGVTYYFTPNQLATQLSTNANLIVAGSDSNALYSIIIANGATTSNGLFLVETTRNGAVSNSIVTLLVANDTTTSNGLYSVETTRNAAVSNAVVALQAGKQSGSFLLTNFLAMGVSNIVASTGIAIGTNGGVLWITNTVSGDSGSVASPLSSVQFNSAGVPGGSAGLIYTNGHLVATGTVTTAYLISTQSAARAFTLSTRDALTAFPVPSFRPSTTNTVIAVDIMPNGIPADFGLNGIAWFDVCDTDALTGNPTIVAARVGVRSNAVEFGSRSFMGATNKPLWLTMGDGTAKLIIGTNGNVGVNSVNEPNAKLDIFNADAGTATFLGFTDSSWSVGDRKKLIQAYNGTSPIGSIDVYYNSSGYIDWALTSLGYSGDLIHIKGGTGYVGIGTTNPAAALTVSGGDPAKGEVSMGVWPSSDTFGFISFSGNAGLKANLYGSSNSHLYVNRAIGAEIRFLENNSQQMVLMPTTGNFGIAVTTPTNTFDVNGHTSLRSNVFLGAITNVFTFGATNPPPASAVAPTKWISVRVAGEAGLYRIPLYE